MLVPSAERSYWAVERRKELLQRTFRGPVQGVTPSAKGLQVFLFRLRIQGGTQHGHDEVREMRSAFIELQPADHAMIGQILRHTGFGDSQVLGELRLDGIDSAAARS